MQPPEALSVVDSRVGRGVRLSPSARIVAEQVVLEDDVHIGDSVTIACDHLLLGAGTRIGAGSRIVCPHIVFGTGCRVGRDFQAEITTSLQVGRLSDIGESVRITAHGVSCGDHLWMTNRVTAGGGGARGPRSVLTIGHRSAVMDECFINLAEPVTIGDDTALSNRVMLLTHSQWQPILDGGTAHYAPVQIGNRCILYVNAVVTPGVVIGDDCTIGAGALVLGDVSAASTAVGNPARVLRSTPPVPRRLPPERQDALMREVLAAWAEMLPIKGVRVERLAPADSLLVSSESRVDVVHYIAQVGPADAPQRPTITLAFGPSAPAASVSSGAAHFDLLARTANGELSPLAEDLRDFLRRRTIRVYSDRPFQALPPVDVARLRARLDTTR